MLQGACSHPRRRPLNEVFCSEPHPSIQLPFPTQTLLPLLPPLVLDAFLLFRAPLCLLPRPHVGPWDFSPSADHIARRGDICALLDSMDGGLTRQAYSSETYGENRSGIIIGIIVVCWILATLVVTLRVYTRKVLLKQIGIDDYFAAASLVSLLLFLVFSPSEFLRQ